MNDLKAKLCPRCGEEANIYRERRGSRFYFYAHHKGGRKCYLGPVGSYNHAEGLLNFSLKGLREIDPYEVAVNAILRLKENKPQLERLLNVITSYLKRREVVKKLIEEIANDNSISKEERLKALGEIISEASLYRTLLLSS